MHVSFELFREGASAPQKQHWNDAGFDLASCASVKIPSRAWLAVGTGVRISACSDNLVFFITPRSGLAAKFGVTVLNAPGTIDAGYRGELVVTLMNHGEAQYKIEAGDRIAQLVPIKLPSLGLSWTHTPDVQFPEIIPATKSRGESGLGSTGK